MKNAAMVYLTRGWSPIPVGSDKRPLLEWKRFQDEHATEAEISAWYETWPEGALGIVTGKVSGLLVLDIDAADPKRFATGCAKIAELLPDGLTTPTVRTRRGGLHYYFRRPDVGMGNRAKVAGFDIDVRCDGGYVVAPPSAGYAWLIPLETCEVAVLPEALLRFLQPPKPVAPSRMPGRPAADVVERARRYVARMPQAIAGSGGHNATFAVACALVHGFALDLADAWDVLCEYNLRCQPVWSEKELRHKLESARQAEHQNPYGYLADSPNPHAAPPPFVPCEPPPHQDDEGPVWDEPPGPDDAPAAPRGQAVEEASIAALLCDPGSLHSVEMRVEDYADSRCRAAYEAICSLAFERGGVIDVATVEAEAQRKGHRHVTAEWLRSLGEALPSHLVDYATHLRRAANKRRVEVALREAQQLLATAEPEAVVNLLEETHRRVVAASDVSARFSIPATLTSAVLERLEHAEERPTRLPTGIGQIDAIIGGLPVGHLTMIGGRPSHGKSGLARCMMDNLCDQGIPCGYISLEDSGADIVQWLMVRRADVPDVMARINAGQPTARDHGAMQRMKPRIDGKPFVICEEPGLTGPQVCQRGRQMVAAHQIRALFIDYLNLMELPERRDRKDELAGVVRSLVRLAKACGIAVVLLAQLNRENAKEGRDPRLEDFKDCGGVEEACEVALLVHRPWKFKQETSKRRKAKLQEVIVAKVKQANTGTAYCYVDGARGDISDPPPDFFDEANIDGHGGNPIDYSRDVHPDRSWGGPP